MDNRKLRLIVDMDGVLADVYQQFIHFEFLESGVKINLNSVEGDDEIVAFPNGYKHVHERGFFRSAPLIPYAQTVLEELNQSHEVFIVSSAMEFPNSLEEKYYWLLENFPFLSWKQFVLCGSKQVVEGDIMIDDHFKNLDYFKGKTLLFDQPHNRNHNDHPHHRVHNWLEIKEILKESR